MTYAVFFTHFVELVNTNYTAVSQDHRTTLQVEFTLNIPNHRMRTGPEGQRM